MSELEYGTYNTKLTTIKHSALASWSGYSYQGQCAILHALTLLLKDKDVVKDYYLSLESYEDFAIMDAGGKIVSLHQCKCYSLAIDFTDECHKMSDKREYYCDELRICDKDVSCYFHSNVTPTLPLTCGIKAYEFKPGQTTCDFGKVLEQIKANVEAYMKKYECSASEETKTSLLVNLVERNIASMHEKKQSNSADFWAIATDQSNWIPFSAIIEELEKPDGLIQSETLRAIAARIAINTYMGQRLIDDSNDLDYTNKEATVKEFLNKLNSLDSDSLVTIVRRLNPQVEWNEECTLELRSPEKSNNLYTLLTSTQSLDDFSTFSWNEGGILESPSTLGTDRKPIKLAESIRKNSSIAFLRDYRWIVGNIDETVEDIMDKAPSVMDSAQNKEDERITRPSKLGLLSINDKNNPEYVRHNS